MKIRIYSAPRSRTQSLLLNVDQILLTLAEKRRVFHSEADFQHAVAWQIQTLIRDASIRLELPVPVDTGRLIHLDLLVKHGHQSYPIELKYKTTAMTADVDGERFSLQNHSAQDAGRYDF